MAEPRTYGLGLPVDVTVYPDGRVTFAVDLADSGRMRDLYEANDMTEEPYDDDAVAEDAAVINRALAQRSSPFTDPQPI